MRCFSFRTYLFAAAAIWLSACSELRLVSDFNPQIASGINDYHVEVLEFISTMETNRISVSGKYKSKSVSEYYASSSAALGNLVVQAEAAEQDGECAGSNIVNLGISTLVDEADSIAVDLDTTLGGADHDIDEIDLSSGSCTAVVLKVLQANHNSMEQLHRLEGRLAAPASTFLRDLINDNVRIALTAENAKK